MKGFLAFCGAVLVGVVAGSMLAIPLILVVSAIVANLG